MSYALAAVAGLAAGFALGYFAGLRKCARDLTRLIGVLNSHTSTTSTGSPLPSRKVSKP